MNNLDTKPDVFCSDKRDSAAQGSKAKQPDNESHKEAFDELLKKAVQAK